MKSKERPMCRKRIYQLIAQGITLEDIVSKTVPRKIFVSDGIKSQAWKMIDERHYLTMQGTKELSKD